MNLKINKYIPVGIILIILGVSLYLFSGIDQFIRPFTQPILMGSSKGKDILFFVLFGITLILSTLCDNEKIYNRIKSLPIPKDRKFYLKLSLFIFLFTAICGLIAELYLRYSLGIEYNTIFVVLNPSYTTTSFLHSHLYKSIFGIILGEFLSHIPAGIHTGSSLSPYTPSIISALFILIPITYISMLMSLQRQNPISRVILSFTITLGIIGLIDGGLFSTPAIGGIYGILIILYNDAIIDEIRNYFSIDKKDRKSLKTILKNEKEILQSLVERKENIKKYAKIAFPHIALILIIVLRFSIAFYGAGADYYELTIENGENIDLSEYDVLEIEHASENRTIAYISNEYNEMELLNDLVLSLDGKCDWYSLSWNIYSYL
ncbi:hypothetical protein [uncultured Methanobrevibacter sp.]|uniref:hypothetical protein n=1 Tax=uncultured Methanobrevibacter sp. TaxID=253161 RepID=UPI0026292AAF